MIEIVQYVKNLIHQGKKPDEAIEHAKLRFGVDSNKIKSALETNNSTD